MPCTRTTNSSPACSGPMPAGVPVDTMSPGSSVMMREMYAINVATGKISSRVLDCCRTSPFSRPDTARSSADRPVAMQGPSGAKVSKPLARV